MRRKDPPRGFWHMLIGINCLCFLIPIIALFRASSIDERLIWIFVTVCAGFLLAIVDAFVIAIAYPQKW